MSIVGRDDNGAANLVNFALDPVPCYTQYSCGLPRQNFCTIGSGSALYELRQIFRMLRSTYTSLISCWLHTRARSQSRLDALLDSRSSLVIYLNNVNCILDLLPQELYSNLHRMLWYPHIRLPIRPCPVCTHNYRPICL